MITSDHQCVWQNPHQSLGILQLVYTSLIKHCPRKKITSLFQYFLSTLHCSRTQALPKQVLHFGRCCEGRCGIVISTVLMGAVEQKDEG